MRCARSLGANWAEQPRQMIRKHKNVRRHNISRTRLDIGNSSDYLTRTLEQGTYAGASRASGARFTNGFHRQQDIHRTGAETFKIERDELETERAKHPGKLRRHVQVQSPGHLFGCD